jgi:Icc-related predicted phosphoesterase
MSEPSSQDALTLAAIGDLHVTATGERSYRELFAEVSEQADVLALCGDLTDLGRKDEAEALCKDLSACTIPVVAVLGNHDFECGQAEEIAALLREAGVKVLDGHGAHVIEGVGFAGVKGFAGGFGRGMLGAFGEELIKRFVQEGVDEALRLENSLRALRTERVVAVLHYAPIPETLEGEPKEIFPFLGSSRLAETIDRFDNVCAILHGHAHRGVYSGRTPKGIAVYNCARHVVEAATGKPYALIEV